MNNSIVLLKTLNKSFTNQDLIADRHLQWENKSVRMKKVFNVRNRIKCIKFCFTQKIIENSIQSKILNIYQGKNGKGKNSVKIKKTIYWVKRYPMVHHWP